MVFVPSYRPYLCYLSGINEPKSLTEQTTWIILDARALNPDTELADLCDETVVLPESHKAHQSNDRTVMLAYGLRI